MLFIGNDIVRDSPVMDIAYSGKLIRQLLADKKEGLAVSGQEVPLFPPVVNGGFYSLPSYLCTQGVAGIKWTSHVKPTLTGAGCIGPYTKPVLVLNNLSDGAPIALVDGFEISAIRTAAVSFDFFRRVAREDGTCGPRNRMLCCGAGHQATWQVIAALHAFPALDRLYVWSRNPAHAHACIEKVKELLGYGKTAFVTKLRVAESVDSVASDVDVIIGATSAEKPYLRREHVSHAIYVHIGMNDIDFDGIRCFDRIVCDDFRAGAAKSAQSLFALYRQDSTIASRVTLLEDQPEHLGDGRVMFDSFGLSIFDVGLAFEVYQFALERGMGDKLDLYSNSKGQ